MLFPKSLYSSKIICLIFTTFLILSFFHFMHNIINDSFIFSAKFTILTWLLYISDNSFSKKGNEISPTPFVISYLFTIPLHLHPLIPPRHWAFPVSLQPHSGVYTNAKGQISSSLVLLDSPFSVADC